MASPAFRPRSFTLFALTYPRNSLRLFALLGACAALFFAPAQASAQVSVGPHLGINFDWDEIVLGGEVRVNVARLASNVDLQLDPALTFAFFGGGFVMDMSFNVPFVFNIDDSVLKPFAAPGLALVHYDFDPGSDTELYLNLIGGLLFDLGSVDPFVELKVMIPHGSMAELLAGVLFEL